MMKKTNAVIRKAVVALMLLFVGTNLLAQQIETSKEQERFAVAHFDKLSWDFGSVPMGEEAVVTFEITNQGTAPLVVEKVTVSCGCTVAKWSKDPIMPQDKMQLHISYNTNVVGEIKRSVVVKTNDKTKRRTLLSITGEVTFDEYE